MNLKANQTDSKLKYEGVESNGALRLVQVIPLVYDRDWHLNYSLFGAHASKSGLGGRGLEHPLGRLDHLSYDSSTAQIFLSCLGDDSVLVIDAYAGCVTQRLDGFRRPQGNINIQLRDPAAVTDGQNCNRVLLVANASGGVDVLSPSTNQHTNGLQEEGQAALRRPWCDGEAIDVQPVPRWVHWPKGKCSKLIDQVETIAIPQERQVHRRTPSMLFSKVEVDNLRHVPGPRPGEGWIYIAAVDPPRIIRVQVRELLSSHTASQGRIDPDLEGERNLNSGYNGSVLCAAEAVHAERDFPGQLELYPCLDDPEGFQISGDRLYVNIADQRSVYPRPQSYLLSCTCKRGYDIV